MPILTMTASLQSEETGLEYQQPAAGVSPEVPRPEALRSLEEHMAPFLHRVPERMRGLYSGSSPLEVRPTEFHVPWDAKPRPPSRAFWLRARGALPDDLHLHQRLLAYVSDWGLLETSLMPHPKALWNPDMQCASLSHGIHFHRSFRLDKQWLCHVMTSPSSSGGRGFALGEVWTEDGVLVASTSQEGLIRAGRPRGPGKTVGSDET